MNKKCFCCSIVVALLCLNLLIQTGNAFVLNEAKTNFTYINEDERIDWEQIYLPHAKYAKLVGRNVTVLDIAKIAQKEQEKNISAYTIIHKIIDITNHERGKMLVKWERDNGYIDTEKEEINEITPTFRRELLKEIDEEEEREREKTNQVWWQGSKVALKVVGTLVTYKMVMGTADPVEKMKILSLGVTICTAGVETIEFLGNWLWNETIGRLRRKSKTEEEIKLPPLRNMPPIPANHTRVNIYSL
jgi:hypothetical protein